MIIRSYITNHIKCNIPDVHKNKPNTEIYTQNMLCDNKSEMGKGFELLAFFYIFRTFRNQDQ